MNLKTFFLIMTIILLNLEIALGSENDFGIANAWFNGENATVTGITLKVFV